MKILYKSREFSKVEIYKMTKDSSVNSLAHVEDGTKIEVDSYIVYEDTDKDGNVNEILSIMSTNKEVYACVSETFKNSFKDILEIFEKEDGTFEKFTIGKISGKSKSNRDFINCTLIY